MNVTIAVVALLGTITEENRIRDENASAVFNTTFPRHSEQRDEESLMQQ